MFGLPKIYLCFVFLFCYFDLPGTDLVQFLHFIRSLTFHAKERARRAAAVEQRLAQQKKKVPSSASASASRPVPKKNETALEQMSRENKGWRDADQQADLRAWN